MEVEDIFYVDTFDALHTWTMDAAGNITNIAEFG
jgi:hypothetical protein